MSRFAQHSANLAIAIDKISGLQQLMGANCGHKQNGEMLCVRNLWRSCCAALCSLGVILWVKVLVWARYWAPVLLVQPVAIWPRAHLLVVLLARLVTKQTPVKKHAIYREKFSEAACLRGRPLFVCQGGLT